MASRLLLGVRSSNEASEASAPSPFMGEGAGSVLGDTESSAFTALIVMGCSSGDDVRSNSAALAMPIRGLSACACVWPANTRMVADEPTVPPLIVEWPSGAKMGGTNAVLGARTAAAAAASGGSGW